MAHPSSRAPECGAASCHVACPLAADPPSATGKTNQSYGSPASNPANLSYVDPSCTTWPGPVWDRYSISIGSILLELGFEGFCTAGLAGSRWDSVGLALSDNLKVLNSTDGVETEPHIGGSAPASPVVQCSHTPASKWASRRAHTSVHMCTSVTCAP